MKLKLQRKYFKDTYTIGNLYIDDVYFCDTLEPKYRDLTKEEKIPDLTAIPAGVYDIKLTYMPRFNEILPELQNVPNFDGIFIHPGNFPKDTHGCILLGKNKEVGAVLNSVQTIAQLMAKINGCQDLSITIYI